MLTELALAASAFSTAGCGLYARILFRRLRTDPLTGLANRTALHAAFRRARRRRRRLAVLLCDVDKFKAVNDTYGHRFGDRVLCEIAHALTRTAAHDELPVRLHGDEFAVLVPGIEGQGATESRARAFQAAVDALDEIDGQPVEVSISVGAVAGDAATARLSSLLASADDRMYGNKHTRHTDQKAAVAFPASLTPSGGL